MPAPKGKAPTKGSKQILAENAATLVFYRNMAIGSTIIHLLGVMICFYTDKITYSNANFIVNLLMLVIYVGSYSAMKYISRPCYSDNNNQSHIVSPGLDLNMEGGMGEHVKDILILTALTHILAIFSNYFCFLLLLLPGRLCYLLWVNLLGPWFFQHAPEDTEQDEKKRKKMERKVNRSK